MDPARFRRVRQVFEEALDQAPAARAAFVTAACGDDAVVHAEVARLLAAHDAQDRTDSGAPPGTGELLAALSAAPPLAAGARLGTWRLLAPLGAGGMGEVWEAEQDQPRRRAALKVLRAGPSGTRARLRFRDEIDTLARLHHPGIARILEAGGGEDGERLWYAMELVPGARPLTEHARGRPWRERVGLLRAVCEAVEHGHRNGVIHRDLKPSNILVGEDGRPRVIDFGVARLSGPDAALAGRTLAGEVVGTLASMAPEQLDGRADVRSDVYALGVVLHELLTGRPPLDLSALGLTEALRRVREAAPPPPRAVAPELPVELDWITARALEKDPELRYPTAGALSDDLRRLLADEPVHAGASTASYRLRKFVRRHRVGVALGALILLLLVGGSFGTLAGMLKAQRKEQEAREAQKSAEASAEDARDAQQAAERSAEEARAAAVREAQAREEEAAARIEAEESAAEAAAVTQFLVDMFERADPALDGSELRVYDALDAAEAKVGDFLAAHPRAEATLRAALAEVDYKLGRHAQAEPQARRALELHRERGQASPESAAKELRLRLNLGQVLGELRRYDEADVELQAVVDARRVAAAPDERLPNALNAQAFLRHRQGRLDEAEAIYREALALVEATIGPQHVDGARIQANLGGLLLERRRFDDAEALLVPARDTLRRELGAEHPLSVAALNNLAGVRFQQRRYAEAAELMQEAYDLRSRKLPAGHRVLLETRANLATLKWATGHPDEAAVLLEEVLAARLQRDPAWHPELVTMLCNLASMVKPRGEDAVRDVVRRLRDAGVGQQADNLRSVTPLENLARSLMDWKLPPEAVVLLDEAAAARARLQPPEAGEALLCRSLRCRALAEAGRGDDARAELPSVRALAQSGLVAEDPRRAIVSLDLAQAWQLVGEPARAEELLLEALAQLEPQPPAEPLRRVLADLAACCDATGRPEEAARWRERLATSAGGEAPR